MKHLATMTLLVKERLPLAIALSLGLHTFVLLVPGFMQADPRAFTKKPEPLEVTLVNSKSKNKPTNARAYAQNNLDGGGNVEDDRRSSTPFPVLGDDKQFTPEQATQRVQTLEQEQQRLMTRSKSAYAVENKHALTQPADQNLNGQDLVQRSLEIARLEAEINKNLSLYEKMPKRKFLGARVQESKFARYEDAWRCCRFRL